MEQNRTQSTTEQDTSRGHDVLNA